MVLGAGSIGSVNLLVPNSAIIHTVVRSLRGYLHRKKFTKISVAPLIAFVRITAFAADVTGAWSGEAKGPNREPFQLAFRFIQQGKKLTGTVTGPEGLAFLPRASS